MSKPVLHRKIIHIDMDAFFASVEQRDFPEFKGKPLVVGGQSQRGVVAAASYEARAYGIGSSMPIRTALRRCANLVVRNLRMQVYKKVSGDIQAVFREYSDLVEPLSLDEAFIDVSLPKKGPNSASLIAKEIKQRIWKETQLTASAGVSYNKFLAKIASDIHKPDGFFVILPQDAEKLLDKLKIEKFFGIGKVTAKRFHKQGIFTGIDLKALSREKLIRICGKTGHYLYKAVRGIDDRPVNAERERKSIGCERTFLNDIYTQPEIDKQLEIISKEAWKRQLRCQKQGRRLSLKVKYANFKIVSRSKTFPLPINNENLFALLKTLMPYETIAQKGCRLLGLSFSEFNDKERDVDTQLELGFMQI